MIFITDNHPTYHCGGKATNLFALRALGLPVPRFVVIPHESFATVVSEPLDLSELRKRIENSIIPDTLINELLIHFPETRSFAVRSSAIDEDGAAHSFAGQFESYLYVGREQLAEKIKQVWLSAFSERVLAYRATHGLPGHGGIAVIVQEMLDAEVAGVAFGINPVNGSRREKVISAVYGLGEGLVSGELDADTFVLKPDDTTETTLALKTHKVIANPNTGTGTLKVEVNEALHKEACLGAMQLEELRALLDKLYIHYKKYQDVEFAYREGRLYVLQARPITALQMADTAGERIIWDNSNIIESYPGVTTPLTFSFILPVYEAVYRQFAALMGVSQKDIEASKEVFANMLGLIKGRVYYNLLSWYKALALLPGYSLNAGFMEKMMGVKERFELKGQKKRSRFGERLRVLNMVRTMLKNLRRLPNMRKTFVAEFNATMAIYDAIDFTAKSPEELMGLYLNFEQTLLKKWKAPLVNDFFAMIYFGTLQKLVVSYGIDEKGTLHNDLISGANDIISTEPIERCLHIATLIQEQETAKRLFLEVPAEEILKVLVTGEFKAIREAIDAYIQRFGNRCVGELKLETVTYSQNPEAFIRIIRSYVEQGITTHNHVQGQVRLREQAEETVRKALKGKFFKKWIFNYFLKRARILVSSRENLRYERTRAFGVVRALFCSMGDRFYAENKISQPRDIFYLTKEEIFAFIKGTAVQTDLNALIATRRKEFATHETQPTPERIVTYGAVNIANTFHQQAQSDALGGDLKGLGCCPGRVRAKVQVIRDPSEATNLNGDILVTSSTDPGWVTLFPAASGILVERGSLLSHSAIVSREMGKPCIVGITGLLQRLKTGDEVEMDGSTGEVKLIIAANTDSHE